MDKQIDSSWINKQIDKSIFQKLAKILQDEENFLFIKCLD